jgi:hypothetical protein
MKENLLNICKSKKFFYGLSMMVIVLLSNHIGISPVKLNTICTVGVALILAQGVADINKQECCSKDCCKTKKK